MVVVRCIQLIARSIRHGDSIPLIAPHMDVDSHIRPTLIIYIFVMHIIRVPTCLSMFVHLVKPTLGFQCQ